MITDSTFLFLGIELTNTVSYSGKRKGPDSLSDGPACKRPTLLHSQFLVSISLFFSEYPLEIIPGIILEGNVQLIFFSLQTPPQTPTPVESMEDVHHNDSKQDSSASLLQNIINIKNECSPVSLNTVQVSWMSPVVVPQGSPREQCQDFHGGQVFSPPQKYQPFQVSSSPHMVDQAPMYQYSPQNQNVQQPPQHYTHNPSLEYSSYPRNSQSPKYEQNLFDCQGSQFCPNQSFASLLSSHGECENVAVPIQTSSSVQQQNDAHLQNFSTMPHSACEALAGHNAGSVPLSTSLPFQNIIGNPVNTTQLGKSFFQWQVEQEENKLANISQEQFLSKDADGDTWVLLYLTYLIW